MCNLVVGHSTFEQELCSRERSISRSWVGWSFSEIMQYLRRHLAVEPEPNRSFTHHLWHVFQMSVAGVAGKEKEEGLRLELKNALKRAEAAEGALARKEVSVMSKVTTWSNLPVRSDGVRIFRRLIALTMVSTVPGIKRYCNCT